MASIAITAAAASAISAGVAAYSSHEQGVAASNADKQKARAAQEQAAQQQITMRQKMLASLATQNAQAAAGGASISTANTMRQITQAQNDLIVSRAGASAQVSLLDQAAAASRSAGNLGAASDLAGGVASAARMWPGGGAPPAAAAVSDPNGLLAAG